MSGDEFYGPALPPGFHKVPPDTDHVEILPGLNRDRKRRRSRSSESSNASSSSQGSNRPDDDRRKLSEKEESVPSERLFGPALPKGFSHASETQSTQSKESSFIGPVLPATATTAAAKTVSDNADDDEDDDDDIGPSPAINTESKTQSTIEQIESRAKLMKDKLEGKVFRL